MIIAKKIHKFYLGINDENLRGYAAQCAYYLILSLIPILIVFITLIQYTNIEKTKVIEVISMVIPSVMNASLFNIIEEIYTKSIGALSISTLFTMWSSGKGVLSLYKGLNFAYNLKNKNFIFSSIKAILFTIIFIVSIIIALLIMVFGDTLITMMNIGIISKISSLFVYVGLFFVFLLMYRFLPNHKVKLKEQIPGAIFSSTLWLILSFLFSIYIDIFKNFSVMYGSLTVLVLMMIWIYSCMYMILIGGKINNYLKLSRENIEEF